MKDPFKDLEEETMRMLEDFPINQIPASLRETAIKVVGDGHPAEYYAGMMHGILLAAAKAASTGKNSGMALAVKLTTTMTVGIAIRWHESCPMEVK
jgi:hypothetical protein